MTPAIETINDQAVIRHGDTDGAHDPRARSRMRTSTRVAIWCSMGIVAASIVAWLLHYAMVGKYVESTNDAYIQADIIAVAPKVSGYVAAVYVANNQEVKSGQLLLRIDSREYAAQLAQSQAQVEVANAGADNARAQLEEQIAAVAQTRAQLQAAEHDTKFNQGQVQRYLSLVSTGAESPARLSSLQNQAAQAVANEAALRAALKKASLAVVSIEAQIRQAEAQAKAAVAQVTAANVNLVATELRASTDGRVGDSQVRVGQFVAVGTRMLSVVPRQLYITANFKETQLSRMRIGQRVTIHVDAFPGKDLRGRIDSFSPGTGAQFSLLPPQNATGNFIKIVQRVPIRIAIDPSDEVGAPLAAGMSVTVDVATNSGTATRARKVSFGAVL